MAKFEVPEIIVNEISLYDMNLGVGSVADPGVPS